MQRFIEVWYELYCELHAFSIVRLQEAVAVKRGEQAREGARTWIMLFVFLFQKFAVFMTLKTFEAWKVLKHFVFAH